LKINLKFRPKAYRKELKSSNVSDNPRMYEYEKPRTNGINCASKVPVMSESTTPNKPFHTPRRASGLYSNPTMSFRNTYQNTAIKYNNDQRRRDDKENDIKIIKKSDYDGASTKPNSAASNTPKQPKVTDSWTSNIFTQISNWMKKDITTFTCKCSEQDKELN
jgi:hypothetical protein